MSFQTVYLVRLRVLFLLGKPQCSGTHCVRASTLDWQFDNLNSNKISVEVSVSPQLSDAKAYFSGKFTRFSEFLCTFVGNVTNSTRKWSEVKGSMGSGSVDNRIWGSGSGSGLRIRLITASGSVHQLLAAPLSRRRRKITKPPILGCAQINQ
jgi:hypothetical protein